MKRSAVVTLGAGFVLAVSGSAAMAAPSGSQSPNLEEPFDVVCGSDTYTLIDAPASPDNADFTPAFMVGTHKIVVPYSFDVSQSVIVLTDGAVFDGVTYNSGDVLFSASEKSGRGIQRKGGRSCTFGGSFVAPDEDDNGMPVELQFVYQGTALAMFPNSR